MDVVFSMERSEAGSPFVHPSAESVTARNWGGYMRTDNVISTHLQNIVAVMSKQRETDGCDKTVGRSFDYPALMIPVTKRV